MVIFLRFLVIFYMKIAVHIGHWLCIVSVGRKMTIKVLMLKDLIVILKSYNIWHIRSLTEFNNESWETLLFFGLFNCSLPLIKFKKIIIVTWYLLTSNLVLFLLPIFTFLLLITKKVTQGHCGSVWKIQDSKRKWKLQCQKKLLLIHFLQVSSLYVYLKLYLLTSWEYVTIIFISL